MPRGLGIVVVVGAFAVLGAGCATTESPGPNSSAAGTPAAGYVRDLSPHDFRNYIEGQADVFVIDLRSDGEWQTAPGPFPQAVQIPIEQLEARFADLPTDTTRPIALFDRTGLRSVSAARLVAGRGYREVVTLLGGIDAWERAGL